MKVLAFPHMGRTLRCASVIIPALNEAAHIQGVVRSAWRDPRTAEVIVVDDCSTDATAALAREAGARVVTSAVRGKGSSMRDGVIAALWPYLVFLDGDSSGERIAQVSIGSVEHESQSLAALVPMAHQVTRTILERALRSARWPVVQDARRA